VRPTVRHLSQAGGLLLLAAVIVYTVSLVMVLVVSQQDQKSQLQNKLKAMEVLRARLLGLRVQQQQEERAKMRRSQVGSGDRSEKIRTYNFPQSRVTDHRIGWTTHDLQGFLDGDIGPLIDALKIADVEEQLADES